MPKVIRFSLSEASIDNAIQELDRYIKDLDENAKKLAEKIAERIAWSASSGFSHAIADDIFTGGERRNGNVSVTVEENGNLFVVLAEGKDAVFIEFGAGVYYNGSAGSSPHPKGSGLGYTIGEYGKGQGKKNVWALPGSTNEDPILTHGTPAAMPMYRGLQDALSVIRDLAKEVFG